MHLKEGNRQVKAGVEELDGRAKARGAAEDRHPITMDQSGRMGGAPGVSGTVISSCADSCHTIYSRVTLVG